MEFQEQQIISGLQKMPENKMTKEIIIPLLRSLGYFKVEFYGGANEQGKDILCWENNKFDELKLTVAQVKHFKFTSTASDSKSFQTVYNQLAQCFTEQLPFSDQSTHLPEEALLISTYDIDTKTLKTRLAGQIWSERITIIDGFKLAVLLKKHKPDLLKKIMGLNVDIYSSLEPTLNNEILLKSLGHFESKSIKHIYIDIDFSLGKRTTQLFFNSSFTPSQKSLRFEKKDWELFKANCLALKSEFDFTFLNNTFDKCEEIYAAEFVKWNNQQNKKENENQNKEEEEENSYSMENNGKSDGKDKEQEFIEPKYQITINGKLLASMIIDKKKWIEKKSLKYNISGAEVDELKAFLVRCKNIIDCASVIFNKKNGFLSSLIKNELNQIRSDFESTRLKLPIEQIFDTELNFSVFGDAGAGKTTCLQMYMINKKNDSTRLFIFLPLSRVVQIGSKSHYSKKSKSKSLRIDKEIVSYLVNSGVSITFQQFQNLLNSKKITLLLDGLDEAIKKAPWLINDISNLSKIYSDNVQIIVTSRTSGSYINEIPFFNITLLPFTDDQKKHFIDCWFDKSSIKIATGIKKHLNKNESLNELVNNPLLTTILCVLAENRLPLPNTEIQLYNNRLDLLTGYYDNVKNISRTNTPPDTLKTLAQKLAFYLHSNVKREEDIIGLEKISVRLMLNTIRQETAQNALNELIDPCNILVPMTDDGKFGFGHLRFQEHLAAKEIINNRGIRITPLLNQAWWRSVLKFFATMNDDLSWFIHMLGKQNEITVGRNEILMKMIGVRPINERKEMEGILKQYLSLEGWSDLTE